MGYYAGSELDGRMEVDMRDSPRPDGEELVKRPIAAYNMVDVSVPATDGGGWNDREPQSR